MCFVIYFIVFECVHFFVFKNMEYEKMYVYLCLYNTLSWMCVCVCLCVCVCACVRAYGLLDPQVHFARMWDKTAKLKFIIFTVANVQRAIKSWTYIQFANHLIVLRFFPPSPLCCRIFFRLCERKDEQVKQTKKVHIAENSEQKQRRMAMQVIPSIKFLSDSR